jgi:hypothetical protein
MKSVVEFAAVAPVVSAPADDELPPPAALPSSPHAPTARQPRPRSGA